VQSEQLSDQFQAVCRISAEAADGLCDDEVHLTGLAVVNEPQELRALFLLGACDTFVVIEACELPVITGCDVAFVVSFLCLKAFKLGIGICRNAAVGGYLDLLELDLRTC
jgi:hypothetical protein